MGTLELLYKKHKLWIKYLLEIGCPQDLCEDIVQEMYLKIDRYIKKNNNSIRYKDDINIYFVRLTLRSLFMDFCRKQKNVNMVEINEDIISDLVEVPYKETDMADLEGRQKVINDWYNDELYLDLLEQEDINTVNYSKTELEKYYLRRIFKEVFYDQVQLSKLSKDTNITYWSLRNTINIIKKQIKKKYETRRRIRKNL